MDVRIKIQTDAIDWSKHIQEQRTSGLGKSEYCKRQGINYKSFLYRFCKNKKQRHHLIPVKISGHVNTIISDKKQEGLCTIEMMQGHRLIIHNIDAMKYLCSMLAAGR
jgi:hypothetical protein